jgi:peptidoglycan/LPS O-acetylase OafA/YrhL
LGETDGRHLRRLTSLRWFAAVAVFVSHIGAQPHGPASLRHLGAVSVSFFFVLSGFALTWSARSTDSATVVWRRRFARIYPATAATMLLGLAGWAIAVPHCDIPSLWAFVAGMLLIQSWFPDWSVASVGPGVTWSLACEAFFYLVLPLLVRVARRYPRYTTWATVAAFLVSWVARENGAPYFNPLVRLPEFAIGICLATAMLNGWRPKLPTAAGWLMLVAGSFLSAILGLSVLAASLPGVVLLIATSARSDLDHRGGWLTSRPLVYLGKLSFCFYLMHPLVMRIVLIDPRTFGGNTSTTALAVLGSIGFIGTIAAAAALHHGFELPMQRRILRNHSTTTRPIILAPDPLPASAA